MAVSFQYTLHPELFAEFQEAFMLVCGVNEHTFACCLTTQHKDIVLEWPNDHFVHFKIAV
jgi:hypothetical protein